MFGPGHAGRQLLADLPGGAYRLSPARRKVLEAVRDTDGWGTGGVLCMKTRLSAGTVYSALYGLEERELVDVRQEYGAYRYTITEAGRGVLATRAHAS